MVKITLALARFVCLDYFQDQEIVHWGNHSQCTLQVLFYQLVLALKSLQPAYAVDAPEYESLIFVE
jgi:hypothetical protein